MFKKGYLLTEVVISIAILAILLPMIYKTLIKTIKVGLEMKEVLHIQKERLYAFQLFMTDHQECNKIEIINNQSNCLKNENLIKYSCNKKRLRRQHNSQIMYLSKHWILTECRFYKRNGELIVESETNAGDLVWNKTF